MSCNMISRLLSALAVAASLSATMLIAQTVHYFEDFTDGNATDDSGIAFSPTPFGGQSTPSIQPQSSWRSGTYLGPATAFNGTQNSFRVSFASPATLVPGNVWVFGVSMISDIAQSRDNTNFNTPGVSFEDITGPAPAFLDLQFNSGPVVKLSASTNDGTGSPAAQLYGDNNAGFSFLSAPDSISPIPTTLANPSMPAALNGVISATWVYQPIVSGTRISTLTSAGTSGQNQSAPLKTQIPSLVPQIWNPNLISGSTGNAHGVSYSSGSWANVGNADSGLDVPIGDPDGAGPKVQPTGLQVGITSLTFKQVKNTDFNTDGLTSAADGNLLAVNIGASKSFFQGDVNGDSNVDATSDGFKLLQAIGGPAGTASAKLDSATGQILLTSSNVSFVELLSAGSNLIPGNAVALGSIVNGAFADAPTTAKINYAGLSALGTGGTLTDFSIGNVLPGGFTNVADLQLRYLNGSTEVFTAVTLLTAHAGDFDSDGDVDGADFVAWQTHFPTAMGATLADGDADGDGDVDGADFVVWQTNFPFTPGMGTTTVPEPSSWVLVVGFGMWGLGVCRRRRID